MPKKSLKAFGRDENTKAKCMAIKEILSAKGFDFNDSKYIAHALNDGFALQTKSRLGFQGEDFMKTRKDGNGYDMVGICVIRDGGNETVYVAYADSETFFQKFGSIPKYMTADDFLSDMRRKDQEYDVVEVFSVLPPTEITAKTFPGEGYSAGPSPG